MSADLHIHVITDEKVEEECTAYLSTTFWSNKGHGYREFLVDGKWTHELKLPDGFWKSIEEKPTPEWREWIVDYDESVVDNTPNIWVGEVSWLKAALFDDADSFVPNTVMRIAEIVGRDWENLQTIDEQMITDIQAALQLENNTEKEGGVFGGSGYSLAREDDVVNFLRQYMGKKVFHISW
jgi:hypothetical protein